VPRARHAADLRRGADRVSARTGDSLPASATASCRFPDVVEDAGAGLPLAAVLTTPRSRTSATRAASFSTPRTRPTRCRRPSVSRCSRW
jgi:hypothetical protein